MLFNVTVWLITLLLALPIVVFTTAAFQTPAYYRQNHVAVSRKAFYIAALVLFSTCSVIYVASWIWRLRGWYHTSIPSIIPSMAALTLERSMYAAIACSFAAILCLAIGRGPHRILLSVAIIGVAVWLWHSLPILHWA